MSTINYTTKVSPKVAERFKLGSVTDNAAGHDYDFVGAKTIRIASIDTVALNDYDRSAASNRFGAVANLGDTLQEMSMSQDKGFTFAIDAGDQSDQAIDKNAGAALRREIDEVITPTMDKYRLKKWVMGAGNPYQMGSAPTKSTIVGDIMTLNAMLTDKLVPVEGRTLYISTTYYILLKQNSDFINIQDLGKAALAKGVVGQIDGMDVVPVPSSWMPAGVYFLIKYKNATVDPVKLKNYSVLTQVQGFDGPVVQGRVYYDSFVIGAKDVGIGVAGPATTVLNAPVLTNTSNTVTIGAVSGVTFKYTVDGTNPRTSTTAQTYSTGVALTAGQTMRAVGTKDGCCGLEGTASYT